MFLRRAITSLAVVLAFSVTSADELYAQQPDEALALNAEVARLFHEGKYADATPLAQQELALRERTLGPNHPFVATSLNNLALLYSNQSRFVEAESLYMRSLAIKEKELGPEHPEVATSLNNLAGLYESQARYAEAESIYKRGNCSPPVTG